MYSWLQSYLSIKNKCKKKLWIFRFNFCQFQSNIFSNPIQRISNFIRHFDTLNYESRELKIMISFGNYGPWNSLDSNWKEMIFSDKIMHIGWSLVRQVRWGEMVSVRVCYSMISHQDYININDIILDYQKIFIMNHSSESMWWCGILLLMLVNVGNCVVITTVSSYY